MHLLHQQQHKMKTNRAMSILVSLLVCCVATSTVTGQALPSFSYGHNFYLGFMKNYLGGSNDLYLMITTTSQSAVSVTIETSHRTQQVSVTSVVPARVQLNHADEGPVLSSDFANRNKGIHVYTNGSKDISVLVMNNILSGSVGEYLAYPYLDLRQESYDYYAVSTNSTRPDTFLNSEVLIVAQDNNTDVTITPTQTVVLPRDAQSDGPNVTIEAGSSHVLILHQRQTLLFNSIEDLSRTKISSDKPLTIVSGHECGNVPYNANFCEHLAVQIPPTVTWGKTFLLAPFAQRSGQVYKMVTDGEASKVFLSCNGQTKKIEFPYEFETTSNDYCYLNSSNPAFLTQMSKGGVVDYIGDPAIAPVVPIEQYFNRVSFDSLPLSPFLFFYNYISITVPAEHYSSNSVLLDGSPVRCTWTAINNASNQIAGYGCTLRVLNGAHVINRSRIVEKLSVMVYGNHLYYYQAYAYSAGMKLQAINFPENNRVRFSPGSLPFYDLTSSSLTGVKELPRKEDAVSDPIYILPAIPLQYSFAGKAFVSENGVISFEQPWKFAQPEKLPTSNPNIRGIDAVSPFWSDNDIRKNGTVRYVAIKEESSVGGDAILDDISQLLQQRGYPDFVGKYAIIAQWDHVHPFPHGNPSGYNISDTELSKTNTYQAVVVTNGYTTIVQFTYMCDGMEWSKSGNGYAVVGFNLHAQRTENFFASGFSSVGNISNCGVDTNQSRKKRNIGGPGGGLGSGPGGGTEGSCTNPPCVIPCISQQSCLCRNHIENDTLAFSLSPQTISQMAMSIPPCPDTRDQADDDYRFIQLDNSNCFVWAFYESDGDGRSFTRQCCYSQLAGNYIITGNTADAGSLLAYHPYKDPTNYMKEVEFKRACCMEPTPEFVDRFCRDYFIRRPNDKGGKYWPPVGALAAGDPHYWLFHRHDWTFDFQGTGTYVLMKINDTSNRTVFEIQADHKSWPNDVAVMRTIAFGLLNTSAVYQFGDGEFEVYQTANSNQKLISSTTNDGYIHWDPSYEALLKKRDNVILAVFKLDTNVQVSLEATIHNCCGSSRTFINLEVFLPNTKEFHQTFHTSGLLGNIGSNVCKRRDGVEIKCETGGDGFETWAVDTNLDGDLFRATNAGRKKRQTQTPVNENIDRSYDSFNYTDEQIALCGDDQACLFDFAATGEKDTAVVTLEKGKNFTVILETLENSPPLMVGKKILRVIVGQETVYNFTIEDPGDNFTVNATERTVFNTSLTNDGNGNFTYKFTVYETSNVTLAFFAEDSKGATSALIPILEVCGCINGGNCTLQGLLTIESTTTIMNCECPEAYSGRFCERDTNGCSEIQCFEGVECIDVQAPGVGAFCGPCPMGYTGDGLKCIDIDECSDSTVCDQICTNTDGSYSCNCRTGYQLQADQNNCQDIDECNGVNDCQQQCNNTVGSYLCSCLEGFSLENDGRNCMAQNPCDGGGCSHTCGLVNGVAQCFCPVGYELRQPENTQCVDKDECIQSPCSQICTNTIGSFLCSCRSGYRYITEQNICSDVDECEDAARDGIVLCVDNSKCINTKGSYNCTCFDGFIKINGSCELEENPVEVAPVMALPAEILANGIRITINNYNKENFTKVHKQRFITTAGFQILWGYLSTYRVDQVIPFSGASIPIQLKIVDFTIRNNNEGKLTFLMYAEFSGGLIPGNALAEVVQQVKKNPFLSQVGFDIA